MGYMPPMWPPEPDHVECAAQMIAGILGMCEWNPIESVPRDGTPVDLFHKAGVRMVDIWWVEEDNCFSDCQVMSDFTHWMYPPAPPGYEREAL